MKHNRSRARSSVLLLAIAALTAACSSAGRPVVSRTAGQSEGIVVEVENQNFNDATVYAVWTTSSRDRLGLVTGHTTQTFTVPWRGGEVRVEVDFIAGDDIVTDAMGVSRGDNLKVTIPPGR